MGSSQTPASSSSPIMLRSHVLPLRPEPKIQTILAGSMLSLDLNRPNSR